MLSIYNFDEFRLYMLARIKESPRKGYGQANKLSQFLGVHTSLVSQVLKGKKKFTLEQASLAADYFHLSEDETEYFLLLVQIDRAGNDSLKKNLRTQMKKLKTTTRELSRRLKSDGILSEEDKAIFYSDWIYSACRQLVAIDKFNSIQSISDHLQVPVHRVREAFEFLLSSGLCVKKANRIVIGPRSTHLESTSPWVRVLHANWRQKAIQSLAQEESAKLHYSCPMTISRVDSIRIREILVTFLETVENIVTPSHSEELHCLNIDWFKI